MMATELIEIDAAWAEKWMKTRVPFLSAPTVVNQEFFVLWYCIVFFYVLYVFNVSMEAVLGGWWSVCMMSVTRQRCLPHCAHTGLSWYLFWYTPYNSLIRAPACHTHITTSCNSYRYISGLFPTQIEYIKDFFYTIHGNFEIIHKMILLCHGHYIFGLASSMCATIIVSAWWHDDKTHSPLLSTQ